MLAEFKEFVLAEQGHERNSLVAVFNRYCPPVRDDDPRERVALVFHHGVGLHKETWIPTIDRLFELQSTQQSSIVISEAWVLDASNHGRAAILNERTLLEPPLSSGLSAHRSIGVIKSFLKSGLIATKQVVAIGHSAGATSMVLSTVGYPLMGLPYTSFIIVEPPWMTREVFSMVLKFPEQLKRAIVSTKTRKDQWSSREEARQWFENREPYNRWDPQILNLFIEYGLRDLPTAYYPDVKEGFTLACTRDQEASVYMAPKEVHFDSLKRLSELCPSIPVHCIFGAEANFMSEGIQRGICNEEEGRRMASIVKVSGAGHLVPQERPIQLAEAIWNAINHQKTKVMKSNL